MEKLDIEKFNPTKADLLALAETCKGLTINGVADKAGYELVHENRMKLKNARVQISKTGKALREEAVAFQRNVISYEKELIALIEPIERDLEDKQDAIDKAKEQAKRVELLPERRAKLLEIGVEVRDDFLITLDEVMFQSYFNDQNALFLQEKENKQKKEAERLEAEKKKIEEEKRIAEARKQAEKDAQEKAARDLELAKAKAEQDKKEAVQKEKDKAKRLKEEQDQAVIEAERIRLEKTRQEMLAQQELEKKKKYQNFLTKHGYTEKTKDDFVIDRGDKKVILYKKVGELTV